jgi:hypothetical protein
MGSGRGDADCFSNLFGASYGSIAAMLHQVASYMQCRLRARDLLHWRNPDDAANVPHENKGQARAT